MAVRLFLDLGNSACKWRLRQGSDNSGDSVRYTSGSCYHQGDWQRLLATLPPQPLDAIAIASVAGQARNAELAALLRTQWHLDATFVVSQAQTLGVSNAYAAPNLLGVDRWLGIVEAYARYGAAIVIDSGSALTIDAVDAQARHLGGYIVPGLQLMHRSLMTGTADVHLATPQFGDLQLGCSTDTAVAHGVLRMSQAFINDVLAAQTSQLNGKCRVIITGGDALMLLPTLGKHVEHQPDLVLDGLERVTMEGI